MMSWLKRSLLLLASTMTGRSLSYLEAARKLEPPQPMATLSGEFEGGDFWAEHSQTIEQAWKEWEEQANLPSLDPASLLDPRFIRITEHVSRDTSEESQGMSDLWEEVAPGVFKTQLLNSRSIPLIRQYIDGASYKAKIPTRRPNSMNRYGLILHPTDTGGAVSLEGFEAFYRALCNYIRPSARFLFRELVGPGDDSDTYAFTIRYKQGEDLALASHLDASLYTINLNLNTAEESYSGSKVVFFDDDGSETEVEFEPGMAVLHRGQHRHAARPIEVGERTNMVIWFHGEGGYVRIAPYEDYEQLTPLQRWRDEL